jgi:hypothetical protein
VAETSYPNLSKDPRHPHPRQPQCPTCRQPVVTDIMVGKDEPGKRFHEPRPMDWSICAHCATILRYFEDMDLTLQLRRASTAELAGIPQDDVLWKTRQALQQYIASTGRSKR